MRGKLKLCVGLAMFGAMVGAASGTAMARNVAISLHHYNLLTAEGQQALDARLARAARAACPIETPLTTQAFADHKLCRDTALNNARLLAQARIAAVRTAAAAADTRLVTAR